MRRVCGCNWRERRKGDMVPYHTIAWPRNGREYGNLFGQRSSRYGSIRQEPLGLEPSKGLGLPPSWAFIDFLGAKVRGHVSQNPETARKETR
eukprot:scaffold1068_cov167-Amphora_coffeaeformis.AAC.11